jgi:hypothetical protein
MYYREFGTEGLLISEYGETEGGNILILSKNYVLL